MKELAVKEILRSRDEKRILTGNIFGIEDEYYLNKKQVSCAIVWYEDVKVLIPVTLLVANKKGKSIIRSMLGSEIDFIILEYDSTACVAIGSRLEAMELRRNIELPKLKQNDTIRVRIVAVGIKHIIVDCYGKEVIIKAKDLKHTYISNCKELYTPGEYLQVKIKKLDLENDILELSHKEFEENPFKNIRKYITLNGEYVGKVIAFPKQNSGVIVQLDNSNVTCLVRIPARFNSFPHFRDKVLIKITQIKEEKKLIYGYLMRII